MLLSSKTVRAADTRMRHWQEDLLLFRQQTMGLLQEISSQSPQQAIKSWRLTRKESLQIQSTRK